MQCDQSTDTNLCVSVCCFPPWHQRESIDFPSCIIHINANQLKPKRTTPKLFFFKLNMQESLGGIAMETMIMSQSQSTSTE